MNLPPLRYRRRGKSTESADSCTHVVIVVSNSCQPQLEYPEFQWKPCHMSWGISQLVSVILASQAFMQRSNHRHIVAVCKIETW